MVDRKKIECWSIEDAEKIIHDYARGRREILELAYLEHAKARMEERDIIVSDILHVLARGYINEEPEESTRVGHCKYKICSKSPNSGNREICLVVSLILESQLSRSLQPCGRIFK